MQIPEREQQIIQAHAAFICQVVAFSQNSDAQGQLNALLTSAEESGWKALAGAIRLICNGQRDLSVIKGLDDEDHVIAEAVMRGMQDPSSLPDPNKKPDASMAAPGLAHMINAAATGNVQALTLISQMAEQMSKAGGDMSKVAAIIRPLINGERDPDKLCAKMDLRGQQLTLNILEELGKLEHH